MTVKLMKSYGRSPWGIFTNIFDREDLRIVGWYFNVHTPWRVLEMYQ